MSVDPFDDMYSEPFTVDIINAFDVRTSKVLGFPDTVPVPFIDVLQPLPFLSPTSSVDSCMSTNPPSPYAAIDRTPADLNYLLSALYPDQLITGDLFFTPPLKELQATASTTRLQLYLRAIPRIPPKAYSANAPIGTGRPLSELLLADSGLCVSPATALRCLAEDLLADENVPWIAARYTLLSELYNLPQPLLASIRRGMLAMTRIPVAEWTARREQLLAAGVDHTWELDARLEAFLLESWGWGLGRWTGNVEVALGLDEGEREAWAEVYVEAGRFLDMAMRQVWEKYGGAASRGKDTMGADTT